MYKLTEKILATNITGKYKKFIANYKEERKLFTTYKAINSINRDNSMDVHPREEYCRPFYIISIWLQAHTWEKGIATNIIKPMLKIRYNHGLTNELQEPLWGHRNT